MMSTDLAPDNGQDTLSGGDGADTIFGMDDADTLYGDAGDDSLDGGIDGLVHLSDISWEEGEDAVHNYKKGQEIEAAVLAIDADRERISLGIKQLDSDPFTNFTTLNDRGATVTGVVKTVDAKGAEITLGDDIIGYLRASEISRDRVEDARNVLTMERINGIPVTDMDTLRARGVDLKLLGERGVEIFFTQVFEHNYFHADMHPGNIFVSTEHPDDPKYIAVDFGIMGRIGPKEQRFLAEILYGFITRNYRRMARLHIAIGYVPESQSVDDFALALRSIGEPMHGRKASEISMAQVLGQLFAVTEMFDMKTRPELILLQKNMVLVEGVGRMLDPELDIWTVAEPVVGDWVRRRAGPIGRAEAGREHVETLLETLGRVPGLVRRADALLAHYEDEADRPRNGWFFVSLGLVALLAVGAVWVALS